MQADKYNKPLDEALNDEEQHVLGVMMGVGKLPGSFTTKLIDAIAHADMMNTARLHSVYPELVDAVKAYQYGNLYDRWAAQNGAKRHGIIP